MLFVPPSIPFMVPEAEAHYSPEADAGLHTHSNPTDQFTIEYLSISEFYTHNSNELKIRYIVAGYYPNFPGGLTMTKEIIKPDGTMGATDHESYGILGAEVWHQSMGYVLDPFNGDGWTMKVCIPELGMCVEQNFDISFASLDLSTPTIDGSTVGVSTTYTSETSGDTYTSETSVDAEPESSSTMELLAPTIHVHSIESIIGGETEYPHWTSFTPNPDGAIQEFEIKLSGNETWNYPPPDVEYTITPTCFIGGSWVEGEQFFPAWLQEGEAWAFSAFFPIGWTTFPCTVVDSAGNTASTSVTISVSLEYHGPRGVDVDMFIPCSSECNLSNYLTTTEINNPNFMPPAIVASGEFVTVVWQINVGGSDPVYYAKSHDGGLTFTESGYVGKHGTGPSVGELWSVFDESGNNTEGLVWDGNSDHTSETVGNNTYTVWSENICPSSNECADNDEVFFSRNNSPPINLSNNAANSVGPYLAVGGNNIYVAWKEYGSGADQAYAARSIDGGISFEQPIIVDSKLHDFMGNSMNISLAASNGNVYAVWQNNDIIFDKLDFDSSLDMVPPVVTVPNTLRVFGERDSEQVVTFDVSATDNVGVVSGPTCFRGMTIPIHSGSTVTITGSSSSITCSATDAAGNVGYGQFGLDTSDRYDFTLPSECPADIRQSDNHQLSPLTVTVNENEVTTSITMEWLGLGDFTSEFVYQSNGQTVWEQKVLAPTNDYPTFTDTIQGNAFRSTFSPGEYTVFACLFHSPGQISLFGNTYYNEPVTRYAERATFLVETPEIVIPSWIKNNAGWWASDQISDFAFVTGLQWLITEGIMVIG